MRRLRIGERLDSRLINLADALVTADRATSDMAAQQVPQNLVIDPELPPERLLVVPDLNTMMDVALASRLPAGKRPRLVTAPGEHGMSVAIPGRDSGLPYHVLGPMQQSLTFYQSITQGRFGAQQGQPGSGVPASVFTSDDALALLATKLRQSPNAKNSNLRGFGWSHDEAQEFLEDFVLPFVRETGGTVFEQVPIVDPRRYGQEDGAIIGIADTARRHHASEITEAVVVTRDKEMTRLAGKRSYRAPGPTAVLQPHDYVMDSVAYAGFQRANAPSAAPAATPSIRGSSPAPSASAARQAPAPGPSPAGMPTRRHPALKAPRTRSGTGRRGAT